MQQFIAEHNINLLEATDRDLIKVAVELITELTAELVKLNDRIGRLERLVLNQQTEIKNLKLAASEWR